MFSSANCKQLSMSFFFVIAHLVTVPYSIIKMLREKIRGDPSIPEKFDSWTIYS